jgi:competence protein ComEC
MVYIFWGDRIFTTLPDGDPIFAYEGEIIVSFIDVGQGDAILIRSAQNTVLIDAGDRRPGRAVADYLNAANVTHICYVVATHPHADHIGGLLLILRDFEIGTLLKPDISHTSQTYLDFMSAIYYNSIATHVPYIGQVFTAGIIELTTLGPPPGHHTNLNNASIVMRLEHGTTSFLFTGDAEREAEQWMVANDRNALRSDVLKVGHHGSRTSTIEEFLAAVSPTIAVIQSGAGNQHGHPHTEVVDRLLAHSVRIYRNDQLGTIRKITDGYTIRTA